MPARIAWMLSVEVAGGPKASATRSITVEAYDQIVELVIPAAAADQEVEVQPGGADQVRFLLIQAARYDPPLTYKVNVAGNPEIALDADQLLVGAGAVGLLGAAPTRLLFSNATGQDTSVSILVGRKATA